MDAGTVSSWVAAGIALGSLGITVWLRGRDRAEADFVLGSHSMPQIPDVNRTEVVTFADMTMERRVFTVAVANDGDGVAHRVVFDGEGIAKAVALTPDPTTEGSVLPWESVPRIEPGEVLFVVIWPERENSVQSDLLLHIRWRRSPTRHRRDAETWVRLWSMPPHGRLPRIRGHIRRRRALRERMR